MNPVTQPYSPDRLATFRTTVTRVSHIANPPLHRFVIVVVVVIIALQRKKERKKQQGLWLLVAEIIVNFFIRLAGFFTRQCIVANQVSVRSANVELEI